MRWLSRGAVLGGVALGLTVLVPSAHAAVIQVGSQAALGAGDSVAWDQLGPAGTHLFTPVFATSAGGTVVDVSSPPGEVFRRDEGVDVTAGFAAGTPLLFEVNESEPVQLTWAPQVFGVGAEISESVPRDFVATLTLFNGGTVLGSVSAAGGDGPVFVGAFSDVPITRVRFSTTGPGGLVDAGFLLGALQLVVSVPEPSSVLLLLGGLVGFGLMRRRAAAAS